MNLAALRISNSIMCHYQAATLFAKPPESITDPLPNGIPIDTHPTTVL